MSLFDTLNNIAPDDEPTEEEQAPMCDRDAFYEVVDSRRSVRRFTDEPVDDAAFARAIEAALLAPNSSNLQSWEFIRVKSPELRAKVAQAAMGQPAATTAAEILVCVARLDTWKKNSREMAELLEEHDAPQAAIDYYRKLVPITWSSGPLGVFGHMRWLMSRFMTYIRPIPHFNAGDVYPRLVAVKTCALACENFMLAMRAEGYDTCPMEGFDARRVARLLDIRGRYEIAMLIGVGRRAAGGVYGPRLRFDTTRFVSER